MSAAMSQAFVALGSNIDPVRHLSQAARALRRRFPDVRFSACYRNPAFGFEGPDFVNAVAGFSSTLPVTALLARLREIETESGRHSGDPKWGSRAIDLDLLLYGERVETGPGYALPRADLTRRVYMLGPLAQLAPERRLTPSGPTVAELWASFPRDQHVLAPFELDLNAASRSDLD
jgi:2-amino-4-hydroxy-6-hydroxymethyldihydropteridine diphosphokinase